MKGPVLQVPLKESIGVPYGSIGVPLKGSKGVPLKGFIGVPSGSIGVPLKGFIRVPLKGFIRVPSKGSTGLL